MPRPMDTSWMLTTIAGLIPPEYSALWGDTKTPGGRLLYDVGVLAGDWTRSLWAQYIRAVAELQAEVARHPSHFAPEDPAELSQLMEWAQAHYVAAPQG